MTPKLGNLCSDELILLPSFLLRNAIEVKMENLSEFVFREGHRPWLQIDADSTDGCFHPWRQMVGCPILVLGSWWSPGKSFLPKIIYLPCGGQRHPKMGHRFYMACNLLSNLILILCSKLRYKTKTINLCSSKYIFQKWALLSGSWTCTWPQSQWLSGSSLWFTACGPSGCLANEQLKHSRQIFSMCILTKYRFL